MKTFVHSLILALTLPSAFVAVAQHQTLTVNADQSKVLFSLTGTGHEVQGTFHVQSGRIDFDRGASKMSGTILVSAASGESGDSGRDNKMHSDVLDVAHFADVTFAPQSYQGTIAATGDSTIQVSGVFTLHGTPHDLTVPMQVHIEGGNLVAKGTFDVPYVKWGLKDPSFFVLKVAKDVKIDLELVGTVSPAS